VGDRKKLALARFSGHMDYPFLFLSALLPTTLGLYSKNVDKTIAPYIPTNFNMLQ
jgi:hypothetical protein